MQFFWFHAPPIHKLGRIVDAVAILDGNIEDAADDAQRAIESRGAVILAVANRPIRAVLLTDLGNISRKKLRPGLFEGDQDLLFVEFSAWFVVVVVFDFVLAHFDDHFAFDGLAFVDSQSPVILKEIRQLELGNVQHVGFE